MKKIITLGLDTSKKAIEWIVLKVWGRERKALLIMKKGFFYGPFDNKEDFYPSWEKSLLREYLNKDVLNGSFSSAEQSCILPVKLPREKTELLESEAYDTYDRLFVLSLKEAQRYFDSNDSRIAICLQNDRHSSDADAWWLRSRGEDERCIAYVSSTGSIEEGGHYVDQDRVCVRPAFYLDYMEFEKQKGIRL